MSSYDMKKMHTDDWKKIFKQCKKNHHKLLSPFYSRKDFIIDIYRQQLGTKPDLDNPITFTEKQNTLTLNKPALKTFSNLADKKLVRNYVKSKIGSKYLIPQYLYTKKITVQDLESLPNAFVLKTTNGSGTNYIVENKSKENLPEIASYMNWLSKLKYGYMWGEFHYNQITPAIIAEKLLLDKKGNIPDDLKCFCFKDKKGIRRKILYTERVIGDDRYRIMFDENWQPVDYSSHFGKLDIKLKKPKNYKEILHVIDKLSEDFDFVRVDLFTLGDEIYFGELTFFPTAGFMNFENPDTNKLWGSWIS